MTLNDTLKMAEEGLLPDRPSHVPCGPQQGKVWGLTARLFAHHGVEAHLIHAVRGGYCSVHRHAFKWNRFVVLSGKLEVRVFREEGVVDVTVLGPDDVTDVPPGTLHQFIALEPTAALEFYWVSLDPGDIDRKSQGGLLP